MPRRKGPYRHPVKSHVRSGNRVRNYERGKGNKPRGSSKNSLGRGGVNYRVQVFYPGGSETHSVGGSTYVGALKSGLTHLETDATPSRVHLKRGG